MRLVGPLEHFELISQVTDELNCIFLILLVQFVFPILVVVIGLLPLELILILV